MALWSALWQYDKKTMHTHIDTHHKVVIIMGYFPVKSGLAVAPLAVKPI